MAGPQYITDPEEKVRVVVLDGLTALFHTPSGMTHIVAPPAPEILAALREGPATIAELIARLNARYDFEDGCESEAIEARLAELEQAGLVSRSYPPCEAQPHGEGDRLQAGGGASSGAASPSTALRAVPLPIASRQGG